VLGEATYESLARKGETMTTAVMVTYAYDQIDQARAELNVVSKQSTSATLVNPLAERAIPHVAMSQKFVSQPRVSSSTFR
jgi:hypothetical protein